VPLRKRNVPAAATEIASPDVPLAVTPSEGAVVTADIEAAAHTAVKLDTPPLADVVLEEHQHVPSVDAVQSLADALGSLGDVKANTNTAPDVLLLPSSDASSVNGSID
jgi:hypothetical protein